MTDEQDRRSPADGRDVPAPAPGGAPAGQPATAVAEAGSPPAPAVTIGAGPQRLDPRIVRVWTTQGAISTALPALILAAAEVVLRVAGVDLPWPPGIPVLVVGVIGGLFTWRLPDALYRHWSYELAEDALELRKGVMDRTHSAIPYWRVQYIDVQQGPIERSLGLSRLVVHTAAATTDAQIPGIAAERAEALRRLLLERAGTGDAV